MPLSSLQQLRQRRHKARTMRVNLSWSKPMIRNCRINFVLGLFCLLLPVVSVNAQTKNNLNKKTAQKLIARTGGSELTTSVVRVQEIQSPDASTTNVISQVELAFRLMMNEAGKWRVVEIRTGDRSWEDVELIARAAGASLPEAACDEQPTATMMAQAVNATPQPMPQPANTLDVKLARCLIAHLVGIELPSDAVRVKEVAPLDISLNSRSSATVVAEITMEFRLSRGADGKWRVAEIRTGSKLWKNVAEIVRDLNDEKKARAHAELEIVGASLEVFRRERGFYVVAESEAALIDQLAPRYLSKVIRVDPWQHPYLYQGTRFTFTLRSAGADGKPNTEDDIVIRQG
jgi:hypothetical protein